MARTIRIKNISGISKTWMGTVVQDGYHCNIPSTDIDSWGRNGSLLKDILDGYAIVGSGDDWYDSDPVAGLDYLKGRESSLDVENHLEVVEMPRLGSGLAIVTHNFCDPCTWFEQSIRVDGYDGEGYGELLTSQDGYLIYNSEHENWIDLSHGRYNREDAISSSYLPTITVNGETKIEDQDFTIFYEDGYVKFNQALTSSDSVYAEYSYESGSCFTYAPDPGKRLRITYTELQFTTDVDITNAVTFQVYVYNPYYPTGPLKVPYGAADTYKCARDFIDRSNGGRVIPKFGELNSDIIILPFNYLTVKDLSSSVGAEIRVTLANDIPIEGQVATLTAYALSEDDPDA